MKHKHGAWFRGEPFDRGPHAVRPLALGERGFQVDGGVGQRAQDFRLGGMTERVPGRRPATAQAEVPGRLPVSRSGAASGLRSGPATGGPPRTRPASRPRLRPARLPDRSGRTGRRRPDGAGPARRRRRRRRPTHSAGRALRRSCVFSLQVETATVSARRSDWAAWAERRLAATAGHWHVRAHGLQPHLVHPGLSRAGQEDAERERLGRHLEGPARRRAASSRPCP